jgi:hypothetical protein
MVTIGVTSDGGVCPEAADPVIERVLSGGKVGSVLTIRRSHLQRTFGAEFESVIDAAAADFSEERGGPWAFHRGYAPPPIGTCTVSAARGALGSTGSPSSVRILDAGAQLNVSAGGNPVAVGRDPQSPNVLGHALGAQIPGFNLPPLVLNPPSQVQVQSGGGPDVGPFSETVGSAATVQWTNRAQIVEVNRSNPLTVTWTNSTPPSLLVTIAGGAADAVSDSRVTFFCIADAGAGTFTVPSYVLSALPAARTRESQTESWLEVWGLPESSTHALQASGIDEASVGNASILSSTVRYR